MKNKKKANLSVIITGLGVAIGFLGELMPDSFKAKVATLVTQTLGLSFTKFWLACVVFLVIVSLIFVWKQEFGEDEALETNKDTENANRTVVQLGDKSVYVEKNDGEINIS